MAIESALLGRLQGHAAGDSRSSLNCFQHQWLLQTAPHPKLQPDGLAGSRTLGSPLPVAVPGGITGEPDRRTGREIAEVETTRAKFQAQALAAEPFHHHHASPDLLRRLKRR